MYAPLGLSLLALLSSFIPAVIADCDCYETSTEDYFTDYQFHDFRSISPVEAVPPLPSTLPKDLDPTAEDYVTEPEIGFRQAGWIQSSDYTDNWATMDWGKLPSDSFPIRMQNSLANVYISGDDVDVNATSKLVLRTHRFNSFHSSAEVENHQKNLFYASIRIRTRVHGASGAVAGLFIFKNGQNESDIEILTRDNENEIRYSNQPTVDEDGDEVVGASTSVDMTTGDQIDGSIEPDKRLKTRTESNIRWDDWHTHRIDWTEGKSSWFIDGEHYLDKTYGVPNVPSYFVMNMWSDGGVWSGNMTVGESAFLEVEWVEMVFNTSGPIETDAKVKRSDYSQCGTVCVVDEVQEVGVPEERGAAATIMVRYSLLVGGILLTLAGMGVF